MRCVDSKIAFVSSVLLPIWLFVILPLVYLPKREGMFLGLDNTAWTAIGATAGCFYCLLTAGLLWFAIYQIRSAKFDAKINRTLNACEKYDIDPVLDRVVTTLADALDNGDLVANPKKYRVDATSLLNYLEAIAIGLYKDLYDREIVTDQLRPIICDHVNDLILSGVTGWPNLEEEYDHLMKLYREWQPQ
jgi:hypothetical protein